MSFKKNMLAMVLLGTFTSVVNAYTIVNKSKSPYLAQSPSGEQLLLPDNKIELHDLVVYTEVILTKIDVSTPERAVKFTLRHWDKDSLKLVLNNDNVKLDKSNKYDDNNKMKYPPTKGEAYLMFGDSDNEILGANIDRTNLTLVENEIGIDAVNVEFYKNGNMTKAPDVSVHNLAIPVL